MGLAIGILLFVLVYGPIAYMIYDELQGRGRRGRARPADVAPRGSGRLHAAGHPIG